MLGELEAASPHLKIKDADPDFRLASSVIVFNSRSPSYVNIYLSQTIIIRVFNFSKTIFFQTVIFRRKKDPASFLPHKFKLSLNTSRHHSMVSKYHNF